VTRPSMTPRPDSPGEILIGLGGTLHHTGQVVAPVPPTGQPLDEDALTVLAIGVVEWACSQGADREAIRAMT
jgi:hypothetical protein